MTAVVDFATFCYAGDAHRLHAPGQLKRQVESNGYPFDLVIIIHQLCNPFEFDNPTFNDCEFNRAGYILTDLNEMLRTFDIDIDKPQYVSPTDKAHTWKNHTVNHLAAVMRSSADYIVFADNDCWMVRQPSLDNWSWVKAGIEVFKEYPDVFIVSPNDGEPERRTQVISQQMFMARTDEFRQADFNQPGWDGDVTKLSEMPEYASMMEGRIHFYCKATNRYRYVLGPEYRYWHHNRLNEEGHFETRHDRY